MKLCVPNQNQLEAGQDRTSSGTGASISICFIFFSISRCLGNILVKAIGSRNRRVSKNIETDTPVVQAFVGQLDGSHLCTVLL